MVTLSKKEDAARQQVTGYGDGGFRISGTRYEGTVLVTPEKTTVLAAAGLDTLDTADLESARESELLLVGEGTAAALPPEKLRIWCEERGIAVEVMGAGAAARTYNVLMIEDRAVAALLFPLD